MKNDEAPQVRITVSKNPLSPLSIIRMFFAWILFVGVGAAFIGGLAFPLVSLILGVMWIVSIVQYYGEE